MRYNARVRVVFMGSPDFAVPSLEALVAAGHEVALVVTQPDKPAGRGAQLTKPAVKLAAEAHGREVFQPKSARPPEVAERLRATGAELGVVVAYGKILPRAVLDAFPRGCVNVHGSILPAYRGAAPIQWAVIHGDAETGVSIMQLDEGMDTGPVLLERRTPIGARETAGALHDRLAVLAAEALLDALPRVLAGTSTPVPQRDALATLAPKIAKSEARLDWREPAQALERRVRAFDPWPVAEAHLRDGRRLRVFEAQVVAAERAGPAGSIVAAGRAGIDVATGDGVLRLLKIQPPSGRVMDAEAYLAAHSLSGAEFVA